MALLTLSAPFSVIVIPVATVTRGLLGKRASLPQDQFYARQAVRAIFFCLLYITRANNPATAQPGYCDCRSVIPSQGPYNIVRSLSVDVLQYELHQKQCDLQIKTHEEARGLGFPIGSTVYGIPVKLGDATFSDIDRESWKHLNCSARDERLNHDQRSAFESFTASPDILSTYLKCTMTCTPGVHVIGWTTDDCAISFRVNYVDLSDRPAAATVKTPAPRPTGGTCDDLPRPNSTKLAAGGRIYTCHRNGRAAVTLRVNTDRGPAEDTIAALPDPRPKPQSPVIADVWTDRDDSGNPLVHDCPFDSGVAKSGGLARRIGFDGECKLPADMKVAGQVLYKCESCCNGCPFSYHTTRNSPSNYDPDYDVLPDETGIHWRRRIEGSPVIIHHLIPYKRKVSRCVKNCDFEQQFAAYEASKPNGCPTPKKVP